MTIIFMGSMDFAVPILEGLSQKHQIALVITQPDKPVGRKQVLQATPVKEKALSLGLDLFQPENIKQNYQPILDIEADAVIVAAYGQMIPEVVLDHGRYRAINVHASLLPKYRGGSPMHRAIQPSDSETGVTIMYMAQKMDAGDILKQGSIAIDDHDNVKILESKLAQLGRDLLLQTLDDIDQIKAIPQDLSQVTYAWNIKPEEEHLDFHQSAKTVYNHIRAFNPWPLTYAILDDQKIKFYEATWRPENQSTQAGEIVSADKKGIAIQTGDGVLIPTVIQLEGKKKMDIASFMNGVGKSLFTEGKVFK